MATYGYDALGLRVSATTTITSKTTGSSKTTTRDYLFDLADRVIHDKVISISGQLPAGEDPETSSENSYVFANGVHFAKVEGTIGTTAEVYYYHNDHLGSPMAITDSQGNLAWSQDYLPYGEAFNESAASTKTRFTFTGKELDPATGLMYYNARWYDPDLGRFMTEDTYTGDPNQPLKLNKYLYVLDNPLRYTDPSGRKIAVGSTQDDEDDTEEGRHVWNDADDDGGASGPHSEANDEGNGSEPQGPKPRVTLGSVIRGTLTALGLMPRPAAALNSRPGVLVINDGSRAMLQGLSFAITIHANGRATLYSFGPKKGNLHDEGYVTIEPIADTSVLESRKTLLEYLKEQGVQDVRKGIDRFSGTADVTIVRIELSEASVKRMEAEFNRISESNVEYDFLKFNCADFVSRGLRAGGVETGDPLRPDDYVEMLKWRYQEGYQ